MLYYSSKNTARFFTPFKKLFYGGLQVPRRKCKKVPKKRCTKIPRAKNAVGEYDVCAQCVKRTRPVTVDVPVKTCRTVSQTRCKQTEARECTFHEDRCMSSSRRAANSVHQLPRHGGHRLNEILTPKRFNNISSSAIVDHTFRRYKPSNPSPASEEEKHKTSPQQLPPLERCDDYQQEKCKNVVVTECNIEPLKVRDSNYNKILLKKFL